MDSPSPATLEITEATETTESKLRELFGDYKAEWLRERVFDLFTEPSYFPELEGIRPCILIGGRGTGKTTVLLLMDHNGMFHRTDSPSQGFDEWPFVGLYYRIDSNRVAPFRGPELNERQWEKVFGHFFNLLGCSLIVEFLDWYVTKIDPSYELPEELGARVSEHFGNLQPCSDLTQFREMIGSTTRRFQLAINNVGDEIPRDLSVSGAPIEELTVGLTREGSPFHGKLFTFLLDEYENLDETQQRVVNTLLKHPGKFYTFKIGVKQGGLKTTETLSVGQRLQTPADYAEINITEHLLATSAFSDFAKKVCNARIIAIDPDNGMRVDDVTSLFPSLTSEEEAALLGVHEIAEPLRHVIKGQLLESSYTDIDKLTDLEVYVMSEIAKRDERTLFEVFLSNQLEPLKWKNQFSNYRQAFLFSIRKGKTGIRKYYCGWEMVVQLASGNVRLLMELVERCFVLAQNEQRSFGAPFEPSLQTKAFQYVGRRTAVNLSAAVDGARLSRLLLGLGRVFNVLASDPIKHTPELTQFIRGERKLPSNFLVDEEIECDNLLNSAVTELVLIKQFSTKLSSTNESRDFEYRIHPVFSPFFDMPAGKKRRTTIQDHELLELTEDTRLGIRRILERLDRQTTSLPDQLEQFGDFYGSDA